MSVNKDDVLYAAALARLKLDDSECLIFQNDLNSILMYFEKLNELDTMGIPPTAHVLDIRNRFREDEIKPSLDNNTALKNAPYVKDGYFKVPKIIE